MQRKNMLELPRKCKKLSVGEMRVIEGGDRKTTKDIREFLAKLLKK